jgi:serine/threonine-protein kinase
VADLLHAELCLAEVMAGAARPPDTPGPGGELCSPENGVAAAVPGLLPQSIGRYRLFEVLGRGGFGTVYRAHDTRLGRDVALKVLDRDRAPAPDVVDRFARDAVVAALLDHPHIVRLHEAGEHDGTHYIDMELVRGETLEDHLRREPMLFGEAAELVRRVAGALDHAHGREIVHRDVKPSNILLDEQGEPRLTDFGLARLAHGAPLTETGQVVGTIDYIAPEQAGGPGDVDGRADIYGLGMVLYGLLTGHIPFDGARPLAARLYDIMHTEPPAPRRVNPAVPCDLETICLKAMAKDSSDRVTKASEFAEQLRRWLDGESVIRPPSPIARAALA